MIPLLGDSYSWLDRGVDQHRVAGLAGEKQRRAQPSCLMIPLLAAACAALIGWRCRWLTADGAFAAAAVGAAVLGFGGWIWAGALAAFFVSGTALTALGRDRKTQPEHRGRGRGAMQVLGTGGVAALLSMIWGIGAGADCLRLLIPAAFLGSLASAAADTWATELGMLSPKPPRLITTWQRVPRGTSGGISLAGCLAAVGGAVLVAGVGAAGDVRTFAAAWAAGVLAMLLDSVMGATVQASFIRPDRSVGEDREPGSRLTRGVAWITNPVVNLIATLTGALVAALIYYAALIYWQ